ncbi:hypothetical protein PYCH_01860 [Pyrococcus yayanosii CH1]|uniref:Uncharacterized protein n=1 Tax=Pyrococcus yayanosii (strain CH1 / JCM 16557) TaxID=529709 RepID=F8AFY6_PYRYC|nr:hypothetical protein PYCH_01860 [Pyrococcus yayanosii CH1]
MSRIWSQHRGAKNPHTVEFLEEPFKIARWSRERFIKEKKSF